MTKEEIQKYVCNFLLTKQLPMESVCAVMGNITGESGWDVNAIEHGSGIGFGLCQWSYGRRGQIEAYGVSLQHQCEFLWSELSGENCKLTGADPQWIANSDCAGENGFVSDFSLQSFLTANYLGSKYTWPDSDPIKKVEELTKAFCYCWERPGTPHISRRIESAKEFFETFAGLSFTPRTEAPSSTAKYWRHVSVGGVNECIHIKDGSVLPNCVGYAWGRAYEIMQAKPTLSRDNAGKWFGNTADGYQRGNVPQLGAIMCCSSETGGAGHVSVVEEIAKDASGNITSIRTSNSAYNGTRFYMSTLSWPYSSSSYTFQGFIYLPNIRGTTAGGLGVQQSKPTILKYETVNTSPQKLETTIVFRSNASQISSIEYLLATEEDLLNNTLVTEGKPTEGFWNQRKGSVSLNADEDGLEDRSTIKFEVSDLIPNSYYTFWCRIKYSANGAEGIINFNKVYFKSKQALPASVADIKLKSIQRPLANKVFNYSFTLPSKNAYGYWAEQNKDCGYSIYIVSNGKHELLYEEKCTPGELINKTIIPSNHNLKFTDNFQIGVSTWVALSEKRADYIFDCDFPKCSNSVCLKEKLFDIFLNKKPLKRWI